MMRYLCSCDDGVVSIFYYSNRFGGDAGGVIKQTFDVTNGGAAAVVAVANASSTWTFCSLRLCALEASNGDDYYRHRKIESLA